MDASHDRDPLHYLTLIPSDAGHYDSDLAKSINKLQAMLLSELQEFLYGKKIVALYASL